LAPALAAGALTAAVALASALALALAAPQSAALDKWPNKYARDLGIPTILPNSSEADLPQLFQPFFIAKKALGSQQVVERSVQTVFTLYSYVSVVFIPNSSANGQVPDRSAFVVEAFAEAEAETLALAVAFVVPDIFKPTLGSLIEADAAGFAATVTAAALTAGALTATVGAATVAPTFTVCGLTRAKLSATIDIINRAAVVFMAFFLFQIKFIL
jgi:hypothetical protein